MHATTTAPTSTLEAEIAAADFQTVAAAFAIEAACIDRLRIDGIPAPLTTSDRGIPGLLAICADTAGTDPAVATALEQLRTSTATATLRARRIVIDANEFDRLVDALRLASDRGAEAAFETLLRRGLNLLVTPLLAA